MKPTKPIECNATVLRNEDRGGGYFALRLSLTRSFPPPKGGAFLMVSVGREPDILLRRPMAIYDFQKKKNGSTLDILYAVVGRGTAQMRNLSPGQSVSILGPIGNSFSKPKPKERVAVVAGGIGIAPFLLWGRQLTAAQAKNVHLLFGFRAKDQMGILREFRALGLRPRSAVEGPGGSFRGTVVALLEQILRETPLDRILTCGPEVMMNLVVKLAQQRNIPCEASLEAKMGCGLGVCLSCVTDFGPPRAARHDLLVCQDGPIFQA